MKIKEIFVVEDNVKRVHMPITLVGDVHGYTAFVCFPTNNLCYFKVAL